MLSSEDFTRTLANQKFKLSPLHFKDEELTPVTDGRFAGIKKTLKDETTKATLTVS